MSAGDHFFAMRRFQGVVAPLRRWQRLAWRQYNTFADGGGEKKWNGEGETAAGMPAVHKNQGRFLRTNWKVMCMINFLSSSLMRPSSDRRRWRKRASSPSLPQSSLFSSTPCGRGGGSGGASPS